MKKYLLTGIVVWIPVTITLWVLHWIVTTLDKTILLLPVAWRPETWLGVAIPGFGVILTLLIVWLTGLISANIFGRQLFSLGDRLVAKIPIVKSIYSSVKQVSDTLFSSSGQAFRQVVLIRYPHAHCWTMAFQTGTPTPQINKLLDEPHIHVFVPTTPNPTSGFFLLVPLKDTRPVPMSVDAALKHIISMGVVNPPPDSLNSSPGEAP